MRIMRAGSAHTILVPPLLSTSVRSGTTLIEYSGGAENAGTTLDEYFGSPTWELQNAIRVTILEPK